MKARVAMALRGMLLAVGLSATTGLRAQAPQPPEAAAAIVEAQPFRRSESAPLPGSAGQSQRVVLTQLNPAVNAWLLLSLPRADGRGAAVYHLENSDPLGQKITLEPEAPVRLRITRGADSTTCPIWPGTELQRAARAQLPYAPVCNGRLTLRNALSGNRSTLAATAEFLRDHVWGGEQIIGFVKREFYRDAFIERERPASAPAAPAPDPPDAPPAGRLAGAAGEHPVIAAQLGIDLGAAGPALRIGRWYAAAGLQGVHVSVAKPRDMAGGTQALDPVESEALAFLVAFDLGEFDLGFSLGTEHPRLGWSARVRDDQLDRTQAGPDGFDRAAPLVRTGMLAPALQPRTVATFTGGFKREHGAFRYGALAGVHHGSHYGFIEQGVVFSRLQPGLSTLLVLGDGSVEMKTWTRDDDLRLARVRHARQNGVPLVEQGPTGQAQAGRLVTQWGAGNWSGSADEKLRSLRAGACVVERGVRRWLVYGYFSSATPAAMARVFLAYGCSHAMHLDMNALEHTYLALYTQRGAQRRIEHLVPGMAVLDKRSGDTLLPRFLAFPDDRDFFYLVRREGAR